MSKQLEIKTIEHKGVKVMMKIDYISGNASLVEVESGGLSDPRFTAKKWVFANRGLEYMNGWLNILEAMKKAVELCKKDLEADLSEKSAFKEKMMIEVSKQEVARTGRAFIRKTKKK